jgi:hypothetical protein
MTADRRERISGECEKSPVFMRARSASSASEKRRPALHLTPRHAILKRLHRQPTRPDEENS